MIRCLNCGEPAAVDPLSGYCLVCLYGPAPDHAMKGKP